MLNHKSIPTPITTSIPTSIPVPIPTDNQLFTDEYLIKNWKENHNQDSFYLLLHRHIKLIYALINSFSGYKLDNHDLFSEAILGFLKSLNKFDASKGCKLSTYATWWIKSELYNFIFKNCFDLKVQHSRSNKILFYKLKKIKKEMGISDLLTPLQATQISKRMNINIKNIVDMDFLLNCKNSSLDEIIDGSDKNSFLEDKDNDHQLLYSEQKENTSLQHRLNILINNLNDREKNILYYRQIYEPKHTLKDIASQMGLSKERVRQIEISTINKLRKQLHFY